ncbi:MAG TPA: response regulator [Nitrososphaera sp.]|jgi:DNA-binding response OmpR family regulator|nr:response regulator [Nitrososphaera sp.]
MRRIAVVDDEPDITTVLKKGLEHHGFEVDVFNDPQAAVANFRPGNYDLMIIDIRMPKLNGFDLYRELKKRDGRIKVCFLTAFEIYYEEFRKMFPTIDVKAFIRKPVSISNLVSQVNSTIQSA